MTNAPGHLLFADPAESAWASRLRRAVPLMSAVVVLVMIAVLLGWAFGGQSLQGRWPGVFVMKTNTAIGLMLVATAQFGVWSGRTRWRLAAGCLAATAMLISILILTEYAAHKDFRIDQLFFHDYAAVVYPGRTSVGSAVCVGLLAVATLLVMTRSAVGGGQVLFFFTAGIPLIAFGGYLFRAPGLSPMSTVPVVSLQSSVCQVMLCAAGLFLRPNAGLMRLVVSDSAAGSVTRRLLPFAMIVPVVAGLVVLLGVESGVYSPQFGSSLLVSFCAIVFAAAVWWTGSLLWKTERVQIAEETRRKEAERALRESEIAFRELADSMPQMVWSARPDGTVDYYNRQWYEYTGMPKDVTGDASWVPVIFDEDLALVGPVWQEAVRTGNRFELACRYRRASDGMLRWHLSRALPVRDSDGRIVRWFGTNTDVHDRKQLEEEREHLLTAERAARAEAEQAGKAKDEFLATLSHELRTPLNAILGWTQLIKTAGNDAETVAEGLEVIDRNARAQTQIVGDILDMSRIISGKMQLEVDRRLDPVALVRAGLETVQLAASAKGVEITAELDPAAGAIDGDPQRLHQVFWNLLSNAVKFTPRGGRVRVDLDRAGPHIRVAVADTGEGIDPAFLPHVFDRFRQADASTTRRHGGLGLGLAIVRQIVELHGGSVDVQSPGKGEGATFVICLPSSGPSARQSADADHPPPCSAALSGVTVLVVDDEPDAIELVRRSLVGAGAVVRTATSAAEALKSIQADPPDVLVSDIGMPGEDGYALIRKIRALPPDAGGGVPAVAVTAYARDTDRARAIESGFQAHLAKPVDSARLVETLARIS